MSQDQARIIPAGLQAKIVLEFSGLTPDEPQARETFENLVSETQRQTGGREIFRAQPNSAMFALKAVASRKLHITPDCIEGWRRWAQDYPALVARNPRLELRDLLQDLSERAEGSSWPCGFEWRIETWAATADAPAETFPYPAFDGDRFGISPALRDRLRALFRTLGGWLYYDDDAGMVVFAATQAFRLVAQRRAEARDKRAREQERRIEEFKERRRGRISEAISGGVGYEIWTNQDRPDEESGS